MTKETVASYANISIYSAMAVLAVAMILYAVYLAGMVPARVDARSGSPADDVATPQHARKMGGVAGTLTWLGGLLLLLAAVLRGASVNRAPLGNMHEFALVASMFTILLFCVWSLKRDLRWLGVFVVTPVLLVLGMAITAWYTEAAELLPSLKSYWLVIHVVVATFSIALFILGAVITVLYLLADRRQARGVPEGARPSLLDKMPNAQALERMAYGTHIIAFPLWTFTLIAGAIWARQAWGSYWNWDPKETWTFVIWVVYAAYLHARATTTVSRRTANLVAVAGFVCIILNYVVVNQFLVGMHSYSGL